MYFTQNASNDDIFHWLIYTYRFYHVDPFRLAFFHYNHASSEVQEENEITPRKRLRNKSLVR